MSVQKSYKPAAPVELRDAFLCNPVPPGPNTLLGQAREWRNVLAFLSRLYFGVHVGAVLLYFAAVQIKVPKGPEAPWQKLKGT